MQTRITARHFEASDSLRAHIHASLDKLGKYYDGIHDARVVLNGEDLADNEKHAEISLLVSKQTLKASEIATTYEEAVNQCVRQLRRQVTRYKEKTRSTDKDSHR